MVTSEALNPVKDVAKVDDAIARQIEDVIEKAEHRAVETQKARMYYTMPFPGVRYYSFKETK